MMSNSLLVDKHLSKVNRDLDDTKAQLGAIWAAEDHDAIARLASASEALLRAVATLAYAVERLAELPACDGSHG